jgi:hypothetical protein
MLVHDVPEAVGISGVVTTHVVVPLEEQLQVCHRNVTLQTSSIIEISIDVTEFIHLDPDVSIVVLRISQDLLDQVFHTLTQIHDKTPFVEDFPYYIRDFILWQVSCYNYNFVDFSKNLSIITNISTTEGVTKMNNPKEHTSAKLDDKGHAEAIQDMKPSDKLLHAAAVLLKANVAIGSSITEAIEGGADPDTQMMMAMPMGLAMQMVSAMGHVVEVLEDHKIVDRDEVKAYIEKKRAAAEAKSKAEGADEADICPGCGQVHDDDDDMPSPLRGGASTLASILMEHLLGSGSGLGQALNEARRRHEAGEDGESAPEGVTKH